MRAGHWPGCRLGLADWFCPVVGRRGSALFDKVAEENFHQILAIDFNGKVVTAPIIQPSQSSFTSFNGKGEISGDLTKAEARALAQALHHG